MKGAKLINEKPNQGVLGNIELGSATPEKHLYDYLVGIGGCTGLQSWVHPGAWLVQHDQIVF